jgi:hypothetical protein
MPKTDMLPRWALWLAGVALTLALAGAGTYASMAGADMTRIEDKTAENARGISALNERTGKLETHIEYIRNGVRLIAEKDGIHVPQPKKE